MESLASRGTILTSEKHKTGSPIQVLHVHDTPFIGDHVNEDYHTDSVYVCHTSLMKAVRQIWTHNKEIDAILVSPEYCVSELAAIREVAIRKDVPLILHSQRFDLKSKAIALASGVDEYHTGTLDRSFVKRVQLIKRVKSYKQVNNGKLQSHQRPDASPTVKLWFLKRTIDVTVSILVLLALSPLLLIISGALWLDLRRNVLHRSQRVGRNYKVFDLYKFKCTRSDDNEERASTTPVGQFLRTAHLDGIPILLNVLAGDMSLVGISPIRVDDAEKLTKDEIAWRFLAPAGVIGLWRFNCADKMDSWDCVKLDMEYAMTNSVWLDLRILYYHFRNLVVARRHRNAQSRPYASMEILQTLHFQGPKEVNTHHRLINLP